MKRILVVEDDVHLIEILRVHLRAAGHAVEEAADGRRGLRQRLQAQRASGDS